MAISVTRPIEQALDHTRAILFTGFRFRMWLSLGFCAFLSHFSTGYPGPDFEEGEIRTPFELWLMESLPRMILVIGGIGLAVFSVTFWLQARGGFMFLDGVLLNRGAVREPWKRFKRLGDSLFRFYLALLGMGVAAAVLCAAAVIASLPQDKSGEPDVMLFLGAILAMAFVFTVVAFHFLLGRHFVLPIMHRHDMLAGEAYRLFRREILRPHSGKIVLFYMMELLLGLAALIIILAGVCITCFVGALPYVSSVLFLPLAVFFRLYPVYFLEQFGPRFQFFEQPEAETAPCRDSGLEDAPLIGPDDDPFA